MKKINALKATTLALTLALGTATLSVMAADAEMTTDTYTSTDWQTPVAAEFAKLDTSGNGLIMPNEAMRGKAFNSKTFAKADADHDGTIDQNEYTYYKTGAWPVVAKTNAPDSNPIQPNAVEAAPESNMVVADQKSTVGEIIDDSVITAKSKAAILRTENLKTLQISVETHDGEVILSGFVDNEAAKTKAEEVVSAVPGVKSVKNSLEVRS
jgi:hyperosmotically inducible protein